MMCSSCAEAWGCVRCPDVVGLICLSCLYQRWLVRHAQEEIQRTEQVQHTLAVPEVRAHRHASHVAPPKPLAPMAVSSSGEEAGLSRRKPEFDSRHRYHTQHATWDELVAAELAEPAERIDARRRRA